VAEMVARKIGIPFYFVDLSKEYRKRVVDYMFDEYSKGRTPNPDILCNREIKFDAFLKAAKSLGADMVATGHYCRKEQARDSEGKLLTNTDGEPVWSLLEGIDPGKDQSYFLCQLNQEQLSQALFPIGHLLKREVREIAAAAELPSADKKDSQGICFVGKVDLPVFLQQKLQSREGDVIEVYDAYYEGNALYQEQKRILESLSRDGKSIRMVTSYISEDNDGSGTACNDFDPSIIAALSDDELQCLSEAVKYKLCFETDVYRSGKHHIKKTRFKENPFGRIVGKHDGAQFYTIGQRKGLNIGGHKDSIFVIDTDIQTNIIYVGEGHTHKGLSRSCLKLNNDELHWIREDLCMTIGEVRRFRVRIRYRQPLQDAWAICRESGTYLVFDAPQRGIAPGQYAALYLADGSEAPEMAASGLI